MLLELFGAEDQAASGPAQGLVRRRRDDVSIGDRVEFALKHFPGDQAGEVGHVDHQDRADAVGDRPHSGVIDVARIALKPASKIRGLTSRACFSIAS